MNITDALRSLDSLDEDLFDVDMDEISDAFDLLDEDPDEDVIIVDPEAKDYDDIENSYEGKIVLDCEVCHSLVYKDKDDLDIDENDSDVVNKEDQCPYCFSEEGFKIVGKIVPFKSIEDLESQDFEDTVEETVEEELKEEEIDEEKPEEGDTEVDVSENLTEDYDDIIDDIEKELSDENDTLESLNEDVDEEEVEVVNDDRDITNAEGAIEFLIQDENDAINGYSDVMTKLGDYGLTEDEQAGWQTIINFILDEESKHIEYLENMKNGIFDIDENHAEDEDADDESDEEEVVEETLTEEFNKVDIETDESKLSMTADPDGTVTVINQPIGDDEQLEDEDTEVIDIVPETEETVEETVAPVEEEEILDSDESDEEDIDIAEVNDTTFDEAIESYLHECYRNVESFKSLNAMNSDDKIVVEGLITFKSGKTKHCDFSFSPKTVDNRNNVVLEGYCPAITKEKHPFELRGKIAHRSLITESLSYNYTDNDTVVKGFVKRSHKH